MAIDSIFSGFFVNHPSERFRLFEKEKKRFASMLGGGTLIGPGAWSERLYDKFDQSLKQQERGIVFGTGVCDLLFPSYKDEFSKNPEKYYRWGTILNKCEFVGVRGPQSKATLTELGVEAEVIGDPVCSLVQPRVFWQPTPGHCHLGINVGHEGGGYMGGQK